MSRARRGTTSESAATEARAAARARKGVALSLVWLGLVLLGNTTVRVATLTIGDALFFVAALVIAAKLIYGDTRYLAPARSRSGSHLVLAGTIILTIAGTASSFESWDPAGSLLVVVRLVYITFVWFWTLRAVTPDRAALGTLLRGWRLGVVLVSIVTILAQIGVITVGAENSEGRQTAFFGHPNDLGGFLLIAMPLVVLGLPHRPGTSRRRELVTKFALTGLVLYAISATGSMSSFISAGVAWIAASGIQALIPPTQRRRRNPVATLAVIGVALAGLVVLANSNLPVVERFERLSSGDQYVTSSVEGRGQLNEAVIDTFDHWLVTGVGLDSQSINASGFFAQGASGGVHNMFLKILFEAGLFALIGLGVILVATLRAGLLLVVNTRDTALYPIAVATTASAISAYVFANFGPILYHRFFWLPTALVWVLWAIRREEIRRTQAASGGSDA